jgi:hypothetical protein
MRLRKEINDYIFYKLVCKSDNVDLEYIGSTINWKERNSTHKSKCNNPKHKSHNQKKYQVIREYGGWDNWRMLEIGRREQLTLTEARLIEEEYRQENQSKLNSRRCFLTDEGKKEYYETHKKQIAEYYNIHHEEILEYQKNYYEANKEEVKRKRRERYAKSKK